MADTAIWGAGVGDRESCSGDGLAWVCPGMGCGAMCDVAELSGFTLALTTSVPLTSPKLFVG